MSVSRNEVHAARLAQRKAIGLDAAIKAQIAKGESWDGADKNSVAQRNHTTAVADSLQKQYDAERLPRIKDAASNVQAAGEQLAGNARREANLLAALGKDVIDVAEREAYFSLLSEELKVEIDNQHYATFLAAHHGSTREKLEVIRDRITANKAELNTVRSQRAAMQAALLAAGDKLAALAV